MLDRFNDLSELRPYFESAKILEFGTGSSTAYFLNHAKPGCNLVSLEQDSKYLPRYVFRGGRARSVVSDITVENFGKFKGSRFLNSQHEVNMSSFIYVDGPVSPFDSARGMAGPNLDLLLMINIATKVIAVDRRHLTVFLLLGKLSESHNFFPTDRFLVDIKKLGLELGNIENTSLQNFGEYSFQRTCVFIPKKS
jgi:hypothetical protein